MAVEVGVHGGGGVRFDLFGLRGCGGVVVESTAAGQPQAADSHEHVLWEWGGRGEGGSVIPFVWGGRGLGGTRGWVVRVFVFSACTHEVFHAQNRYMHATVCTLGSHTYTPLPPLLPPAGLPSCPLPPQANYGQKDPAAVAKVKEVYAQLDIPAKFEAYEAQSYSKLSSTIDEQGLLPKQVFTSLLKKIYKRSK